MADISNWNLADIKRDAIQAHIECSQRGLLQSAKWATELAFAIEGKPSELKPSSQVPENEFDQINLAKAYFDVKEYDRSAHFVKNCTSNRGYFLHVYARYLAGEKKRLDDAPDSIGPQDNFSNEYLRVLRAELQQKYKNKELDGYGSYLYGVVLKKLDLTKEATEVFVEAVKKSPLHWGSWFELSLLVSDKDMLSNLSLPDHWIYKFFLAHASLELQLNEEALKMYQTLQECGFSRSTYVMAQIAMAHHNIRDVDLAVESFGKLQKVDPYRLENMDTYSNLLYVKEMRTELAHLAHHCCSIDKYRVETCCVVGNYYSLRSQHEKAVLYFQRALKLNSNYLSAWTLMGHEFMELKNTSAAIQAYRQAIEVNKRDYRAWYGLGQTYEILKMPFYCLYYYRQAQMLRPNDARMVVALGEAFEKLERLQEAKKCFWKAHSLGDMEGLALMKLARLYEKLFERDQAAAAYTDYINQAEQQGTCNYEDISHAYKFLANYHLKSGRLDDAYVAAQKCTEFNETREEGKALLRLISGMRKSGDGGLQPFEHGSVTIERSQPMLGSEHHTTPVNRLSPMNLTFTP